MKTREAVNIVSVIVEVKFQKYPQLTMLRPPYIYFSQGPILEVARHLS